MIKKIESNMMFSFEKKYYYSIEGDDFYHKITSKYQAKICDFIIYKKNKILFIEAKSSAPKNRKDLDEFAEDIYQKFWDSLLIFIAIQNDRKNTISKNIGAILKQVSLKNDIQLILIINNKAFKKANIIHLKEVLSKKMRKLIYLFSVELIVLNSEQAKSRELIQEYDFDEVADI